MSERAPYSRVYWSILSDEKFSGVVTKPDLLGAWLLLLINADAIYPAPAFLPASVRRNHLAALVEAGLIDLYNGSMYRVHGLQAERERRSDAARTGPKRDPSGSQTGPGRVARRDETRRDETRLAPRSWRTHGY